MNKSQTSHEHVMKQAGAELGEAQVKIDDIVVMVGEVLVKAMVELEVQMLFRMGGWVGGGWANKTKLILISTLVEVEVELGKSDEPWKNK